MTGRAEDAWRALELRLRDYAPPCDGKDVFTDPSRTDEERELCASICARCPIADLCGAYAAASKTDSGYWAGADRSPRRYWITSTTEPGGSRQPRKE